LAQIPAKSAILELESKQSSAALRPRFFFVRIHLIQFHGVILINISSKSLERLPKLRGELAELAFMYRASGEGIAVAKPYGDSHPYDFLVQHGSRLLRIQVKSTFKKTGARGRFGFQVIVSHRRGRANGKGLSLYDRSEIDFIAAFVAPLEVWYLIPIEKLGGRRAISLYPAGSRLRLAGLYEEYREAWDLLKDVEGQESSTAADSDGHQFVNPQVHEVSPSCAPIGIQVGQLL
jgi:hypothetical protein